jgi:hypothetical protein
MSLFSNLSMSSIGDDSVVSDYQDIPSVTHGQVDAPNVPGAFENTVINGNSASFSGMDADSNPNNDMMCKTTYNTMPPPPRTQNISYPMEGTNYPKIPIDPYKTPVGAQRGPKYMFSPEQNVHGVVTTNVGKDDWVRGNQFSRSYNWNSISGKPRKMVRPPTMNKGKPTVQLNSPFYPEPSRDFQKEAIYKTYPNLDMRNKESGQPQYKDPYNNILDSGSVQEDFDNEQAEYPDAFQKKMELYGGSHVADMASNGIIIGSLATLFYYTFMKK